MLNKLKQIILRCILGILVIFLVVLVAIILVDFFWRILLIILLGALSYILGEGAIQLSSYLKNKRKETENHVK